MESAMTGPFEPTAPSHAASAPGDGHPMRIVFSASGSEYFRIWIVNLLLTLVTLGLYLPWAKVRRLRYFYGNTTLGGHAFDFHGDPKRMLRGLLLVGALVLIYSLAGKVSPVAGLVAFVIVAAVWPALFRASQQFRMANTSWRGLRFHFSGTLRGAYGAMLPLFGPGALLLVSSLILSRSLDDPKATAQATAMTWLIVALGILPLLLMPLFLWLLKKYQHGHYALGQVRTTMNSGAGSFYGIALKTFGVTVVAALVVAMVVGIVAAALSTIETIGDLWLPGDSSDRMTKSIIIAVGVSFIYATILVVVVPYVTTRMQNLVWSRTAAPEVRFESVLRFWPMFRLTLKNWLLILVTLGLYGPFAKVAMARLRLQAVTVHTTLAPDALMATLQARSNDAAGDAAGDLFGIDIGL